MLVRSVRLLLLLGLLVLGCSDSRPSVIDGGAAAPPLDAVVGDNCRDNTDPRTVDFFGETCQPAPFPANTTCHDGRGWCIDGVCRPMCVAVCPRCPGGEFQFAPAGACYCVPRI
ncbi:MAG TPA: hypothetical protein VHT91_09995 [Kofleriaceae bacterium]|jgi:hypothetical protein|nr:hypothetical protein [Kofleriaceae bacterium]